jgi:hypothetical protein
LKPSIAGWMNGRMVVARRSTKLIAALAARPMISIPAETAGTTFLPMKIATVARAGISFSVMNVVAVNSARLIVSARLRKVRLAGSRAHAPARRRCCVMAS